MTTNFPILVDGPNGDVPTNMFMSQDATGRLVIRNLPGLTEVCRLPDCTEVRGLYATGGYLYAVARRGSQSAVFKLTPGGSFTEIGEITTSVSGPVWFAENPTQLCIVDGVWGYVHNFATGGLIPITDPEFEGASSVTYQDGYGIFTKPNSNIWFLSELFDFTSFSGLDFIGKQSSPDKVVCVKSFMREPRIFGELTTETWYNAGDVSTPGMPIFNMNPGGLTLHGCGAPGSVSDLDGEGLVWLSNRGQLLYTRQYAPTVVSNMMFEDSVLNLPGFSDAIALTFRHLGHVFYQITFPAADQTWLVDFTTRLIYKRSSYKESGGYGRHRAACAATLGNQVYVGDYANGKVYLHDPDAYSDDGREIERIVYTQEMLGGHTRIFFPSVQVILNPGSFTGEEDPSIVMQLSNDGGHHWSEEAWRKAGKSGEFGRRVIWHRQGSSFRRMYRFKMYDKVPWVIIGFDFDIEIERRRELLRVSAQLGGSRGSTVNA